MANVRLSTAANNAACNAMVDLIDAGSAAGTINIYDGIQPANANTAVSTQTLLGTLTWANPAFGDSAAGVAAASAITGDTSADATGTASWARILDSDANVVFDCDVGESGATITLVSVSITIADPIDLTSFTITHPDGT